MPIIQINGLKKCFHGKEVIKGLDFTLDRGKCTALIGPNGAGKTTTLRMLSGLTKPTSGFITFMNGGKIEDIRLIIGYLPQFPIFYEWMNGLEFLVYVGKLMGLKKNEAIERSLELLSVVGILEAKDQRIGKYSGGMKQRLGIAQALIHRPQLLILDEPVSALDPFGRREVLELLIAIKKETTVLFSTHILNDAQEICDEILFLHNGQIVESGTMEELRLRHQQVKIDLTFRNEAEEYARNLKEGDSEDLIYVEGNRISISVKNIEQARQTYLKKSIENNWPLVKFEISSMTLEDVFMKVVGK